MEEEKTPGDKEGSYKSTPETPTSTGETVAINLTDPDDLLNKLSSMQLDDEETDKLLKRAYEVNLELKKQLKLSRLLMDQNMSSSSASSATKLNQRPVSNRISAPIDRSLSREQTRMASAIHDGQSRRSRSVGLSNLVSKDDHHLKNYSYHSFAN